MSRFPFLTIFVSAFTVLLGAAGCSGGSSTPPAASPPSPSTAYSVPSDNPFVGVAGYRPEIWALGVRNPWRFSFDQGTGDLYIGDVGQGAAEEIDFQPAGSRGGRNYGWNVMEGASCYNSATCDAAGLDLPVITYAHSEGCSVTGGVVYRGAAHPELQGIYLFGDFCSGRVWGLRKNGTAWENAVLVPPQSPSLNITSFGEDEAGNVYLANYANGDLLKVGSTAPGAWPQVSLTRVAGGFARPVHVDHAGDGSGRIFVVEQTGQIRILDNGVVLPIPFLDIASRVVCCGEQGLLSVAFPPGYAAKGHFYVNYTRAQDGATVVARYHVSASDANAADSASEEILLTVPQPFTNHNGGQLAFGPDGHLYIGMGDGGGGGDPQGNAQNPGTLLGKILRIDVESVTN
ncbi:MAG TPA: PQQ-dependent sugar dehydrogenase [Candidatus Deferrimicrobiaceae bacterium]